MALDRYLTGDSRLACTARRESCTQNLRTECVEICTVNFIGQEIGRGGREMSRICSRFTGVLVTARPRGRRPVDGAAALSTISAPSDGDRARPRRGGQLVASARGEPRSFNRLIAGRPAERHVRAADAGLAGSHQPRRPSSWSRGWPSDGSRAPTAGPTRCTCAGRDLVRRHAVHVGRRALLAAGGLRPEGRERRRQQPDAGRAADSGDGAGRVDRGPDLRRAVGPGRPTARHAADPAEAQARGRARPRARSPQAWNTGTPPAEIVGTGPFVLREYQPGAARWCFDRNPRYWRKAPDGAALPYLDRLVLEIVPEQNAELLRCSRARPTSRRASCVRKTTCRCAAPRKKGKLTLIELGVGPDADAFWFCLKPEVKKEGSRASRSCRSAEFRQAHLARGRSRGVRADGVPRRGRAGLGPDHAGQHGRGSRRTSRAIRTTWRRARELLQEHRPRGSQRQRRGRGRGRHRGALHRDHAARHRATTSAARRVLREQAAKVGIALDMAPLEYRRDDPAAAGVRLRRDLHAAARRPISTRPATSTSGSAPARRHFWNMAQKTPATEWETPDRHADARAGGDARSRAAARAVQRRAADPRREPAGAVLRGAAPVLRPQRAHCAASCRR